MAKHGLGWAGSGRGSRKYHLTRPDRKTMYMCKVENNSSRVRPLDWGRKTPEEWIEEWGRRRFCSNCLELVEA